jgi:GT2 family glycosyltransferase
MNIGVEQASGPVVALCDQDDLLPSDRLARQVAALAECPAAGLACGNYALVDEGGRPTPGSIHSVEAWSRVPSQPVAEGLRRIAGEQAYLSLIRGGQGIGGGSSICFPKQVWRRVGGFDPRFRICWDFDFAVRVAAMYDFVYDSRPLCFHRIHDGNLSRLHSLHAAEISRIRCRQFRRPAYAIPAGERRKAMATISAEMAFQCRQLGWYGLSARSYLRQFMHGDRARAVCGLAKLSLYPAYRRLCRG